METEVKQEHSRFVLKVRKHRFTLTFTAMLYKDLERNNAPHFRWMYEEELSTLTGDPSVFHYFAEPKVPQK